MLTVSAIDHFFYTDISARSVTLCNSKHHQDVQERCRREVMEVLGDEKAAVADMPKMPFVLATIAEVCHAFVCSDLPKKSFVLATQLYT